MTLSNQFYGIGVDALFKGHGKVPAPFPSAAKHKQLQDYDPEVVKKGIEGGELSEVDPRTLHATQPWVTLEGVRHYASGAKGTFSNDNTYGNQNPVVYERDQGHRVVPMLLSGHHRAASALVRGEPLKAIVVRGGYGPPRGKRNG